MDEERKQKLIEALRAEKDGLAQNNQDVAEYDIAIEYLMLGCTLYQPDKWRIVSLIQTDFDKICTDYGV